MNAPVKQEPVASTGESTAVAILIAASASHFLNDTIQSLLPAIYPVLKENYALSFAQVGLITFVFQVTASLLQPLVGLATDRRPTPWALPIAMGASLIGLVLLSKAHSYPVLLVAAGLVGIGSSVFHPEASRIARLSSGGRFGLAQSVFQVGGNAGSSLGPLLAAAIVVPFGQPSIAWFALLALLAIALLTFMSAWYKRNHLGPKPKMAPRPIVPTGLSPARTFVALAVLAVLVFSKFIYMQSLTSYYTFYTISTFGVTVQTAQILLFVFLFAVAAGTVIGGPLGDRFGRKYVIWASILGVLPFTLAMPHVGLTGTVILSAIAGFGLASAFPAIVVFAQELVPGKVGMVSGIFFGFAFGISGIGAASLGALADATSIGFVYNVCSFLPAIGLIALFLPDVGQAKRA